MAAVFANIRRPTLRSSGHGRASVCVSRGTSGGLRLGCPPAKNTKQSVRKQKSEGERSLLLRTPVREFLGIWSIQINGKEAIFERDLRI